MSSSAPESAALAPIVYFTLNESTPENRQKLVDSCHKYLSDHPGSLYFSAGPRVPDLNRPVNEPFDVGLHLIFASRADHDRYQTAERHLAFAAENKPTWQQVRVFDAYVS